MWAVVPAVATHALSHAVGAGAWARLIRATVVAAHVSSGGLLLVTDAGTAGTGAPEPVGAGDAHER